MQLTRFTRTRPLVRLWFQAGQETKCWSTCTLATKDSALQVVGGIRNVCFAFKLEMVDSSSFMAWPRDKTKTAKPGTWKVTALHHPHSLQALIHSCCLAFMSTRDMAGPKAEGLLY